MVIIHSYVSLPEGIWFHNAKHQWRKKHETSVLTSCQSAETKKKQSHSVKDAGTSIQPWFGCSPHFRAAVRRRIKTSPYLCVPLYVAKCTMNGSARFLCENKCEQKNCGSKLRREMMWIHQNKGSIFWRDQSFWAMPRSQPLRQSNLALLDDFPT